jgi:hypothetical protein
VIAEARFVSLAENVQVCHEPIRPQVKGPDDQLLDYSLIQLTTFVRHTFR